MASKIKTDEVGSAIQRAAALVNEGDLRAALSLANQTIRTHRKDSRGWFFLSTLNLRINRTEHALECISNALDINPEQCEYQLQAGRCLPLLGRKADALTAVAQAIASKPNDGVSMDAIGAIYSTCDEHTQAVPWFEKAVESESSNPHFLYNLAAAQRMLGQFEAAELNCDRAIAINPHDYKAHHTRADLRTQTAERNHIAEMEALLEQGLEHAQGEATLRFALAKECEDVGEYSRSFAHLRGACGSQRKHMRYDVDDDIGVMTAIRSAHTAAALGALPAGFDTDEPIFVLGLPRTGTTLVERILASHSDVYSAGELSNFATEMIRAIDGGAQTTGKQDLVAKTLTLDFAALGRTYLESTRPGTGHRARFIDKLPMNYLYCGLMHKALPKAKIIALQRDPMDTCYAVYKAMFTGAYPFSYDLQDLGKYFLAYRDLMAHWGETLGTSLLTVDYETLVAEQEQQSKRIVDFCGLPWQPACLDFHQIGSVSTTASAVQVRQPIYSSSVGKWRNYQKELAPLTELFESNDVAFR